jgi:hypothetical protein
VKDPGPFCKRCYHKHISPGRQRNRRHDFEPEPFEERVGYSEAQRFQDFLGIDNLREHLALESFRYSFTENDLANFEFRGEPWEEEQFAIPETGSEEDDQIPF